MDHFISQQNRILNRLSLSNPQTRKVYELIQRDGRVSRLSAMHYGVANLTARIADLRNMGFNVVCVEKRDAEGRRYGTWSLAPHVQSETTGVTFESERVEAVA